MYSEANSLSFYTRGHSAYAATGPRKGRNPSSHESETGWLSSSAWRGAQRVAGDASDRRCLANFDTESRNHGTGGAMRNG